MQGNNYQLDKEPLVNIPVCIGSEVQQNAVIILVDKMISINKKLHEVLENSNEWESLKSEIEKTDKNIDQEIYKIYGLNEEEIKVIEQ